jgi:hypothetical protein
VKSFITGILLFSCFSAQASTNSHKQDVLNEVISTLKNNPLECVVHGYDVVLSSDEVNLRGTLGSNFTMNIKEGEQPSIIFERKTPSVNIYVEVITDDEYKSVIGLNAIKYLKNLPKVERRNVGTIISPIYEEVVIERPDTIVQSVSCE